MSGRSSSRQRRDNLSPSLFPFLAVLLCTMGSLVLILMLIVSGAQADAKQIAEEAENRRLEVESLAEHTVRSYQEQLENGRLELEEERLVLQHFEEHILELQDELSELEKTAQLLREELKPESKEEFEKKLSELEKQLADATEDLNNQKIEEPDGDKPVFAVIPYEGTSGTHRRPIYLECTEQGIVLQPEGNLLSKDDLRPPYGPGNPLDAALRTVRSEYKPDNGAITETAYPLLLVRPSGVNTYALARAAMSGWDDQFGYELIAEDLELVFPSTVAGLYEKITQSIELARQRQTALAMAMPRKYRPGNLSSNPYQGSGYGDSTQSGTANYGASGGGSSRQFGFGGNQEGRGGYGESTSGLRRPSDDQHIGGGLRQENNSLPGTNRQESSVSQNLQEFFGSNNGALSGGYASPRDSAGGYSDVSGRASGELLSDLQEATAGKGSAEFMERGTVVHHLTERRAAEPARAAGIPRRKIAARNLPPLERLVVRLPQVQEVLRVQAVHHNKCKTVPAQINKGCLSYRLIFRGSKKHKTLDQSHHLEGEDGLGHREDNQEPPSFVQFTCTAFPIAGFCFQTMAM